jgi:hypothetical protein
MNRLNRSKSEISTGFQRRETMVDYKPFYFKEFRLRDTTASVFAKATPDMTADKSAPQP